MVKNRKKFVMGLLIVLGLGIIIFDSINNTERVLNKVEAKDMEVREQAKEAQKVAVDELAKKFSNVESVNFRDFSVSRNATIFGIGLYINGDENKSVAYRVRKNPDTKKFEAEIQSYQPDNFKPESRYKPERGSSKREDIKITYNTNSYWRD